MCVFHWDVFAFIALFFAQFCLFAQEDSGKSAHVPFTIVHQPGRGAPCVKGGHVAQRVRDGHARASVRPCPRASPTESASTA